MRTWPAVVFDMDDTLYPEREYVLGGFQAVARWGETKLGIESNEGFATLCSLFEEGVRGNTFNRWLEKYHLMQDDLIPQLVQVYREHTPILHPFPQVPDMLKLLKRYYRLGLVSDGYLSVQERKFKALGLESLFDSVVFSDQWGREAWKPSPRPFHVVLQQLMVDAERAFYIGDNPLKDFLGARQAGMKTIWLHLPESEYGNKIPPTEEHKPDHIVYSLDELQHVLVKEQRKICHLPSPCPPPT